MKYVWLVLFLAAVFGLCFLADRCIGKVQARAQRRPAVRLPLRYPLLSVLLLLVAPVSAWYGITHAAPLFVAGAVLLAGLFILAIVLAVMGAPKNYLMAVIFSLVFIPIVMYAMGLMTRVLKPSDPPEGMDEDGDAGQASLDKNSADSGDEL